MDIENLLQRFKARKDTHFGEKALADLRVHYRPLLEEYEHLKLTLPIDDDPVKRVCQVLTNNGYITSDSCEGHGQKLPYILFECEDQQHLRHLAHIVAGELLIANFPWQIIAWSSSPGSNPDSPLCYFLEPSQRKGLIDPKKDHARLLGDLDIIGLIVFEYFKEEKTFNKRYNEN